MPLSPKPVSCACPAEFTLAVLDTLPGGVQMAACTRCGRSDLADPVATEDRPHDVQFHGFRFFELSPEARDWASAWPRYAVVGERRIYLSAAIRFETVAGRDAAIAEAAAQQASATFRETLLALGIPSTPPPASLPESLAGFVQIWDGLKLNGETPVEELLDDATRFNGPSRLAADVLARRTDLPELAVRLLHAPDETRRGYGRYLVQRFALTGSDILASIRERLAELDDNQTGELYDTVALLRRMGRPAAQLLPDLEAAADRVKNRDYYVHQDLTKLIQHCRDFGPA